MNDRPAPAPTEPDPVAPEQARAHFVAGNTHFAVARLDQARACFEAALALAPGRASVLASLGVPLFRLGRWPDAIELGAGEALHRFYLASLQHDATPAKPPRLYVQSLFDQYAGKFEHHLVQDLHLRGAP